MVQRYGWRRLLLCAVLEFAALTGAPLRPKDIESALRPRNEIAAQQQTRGNKDEPDPILPDLANFPLRIRPKRPGC
jgi:hypothetical protein